MKEQAVKYFLEQGYSCSEAIVKSAADKGLVNKNLVPLATPFSGGMGSGCLCGAIAGMQLVIGAKKGREDNSQSPIEAKSTAKEALSMFKEKHKASCCRVLCAGFEMGSQERKKNCCKYIEACAGILEEIFKEERV